MYTPFLFLTILHSQFWEIYVISKNISVQSLVSKTFLNTNMFTISRKQSCVEWGILWTKSIVDEANFNTKHNVT